MGRREVIARLGDQKCEVKTLDSTHLYCEPPEVQPMSVDDGHQLPRLKVTHLEKEVWFSAIHFPQRCLFLQKIINVVFH